MSIYARIFTVIIATAVAIVISGLAAGAYFLTRHISDAIEKDMMIVVEIADKYVANEIKLLKIQAGEVARALGASYVAGAGDGALQRACAAEPTFIGAAVFAGARLQDSWGKTPVPPDLSGEAFMGLARDGGAAISTTMHSPDGTLVMYVAVPMGQGLVLAAALPGRHFSDLLSGFTVYQTGHLFIDDAEGHVIVNIRPEWVEQRLNFAEMGRLEARYREIGAVVERAISGEEGTGRFSIDGVPRLCAFRPVSSPNENWFLGLIAPLPESPLKEIPRGLLMIGLVTLGLSLAAALLAARLLRRPYVEMERLRETAVQASNAKSAFIASMSHEIRTPLNAVIGFSELALAENGLSRETGQSLEKIRNAGATILSIVNDILDVSKIESGKFAVYPVQYDTPSLINDTVTLNIVRIGEKKITFKLRVDENLPGTLYGDDLRVKQIFSNLLSNAFKFTNSGTVEWRISFEREGDSVWLVSSVRDTGIGIKPEDLLRLFDAYNQVDAKANRSITGTGLGLTIAKRLLEIMDGSITVESEYGRGTTFNVRLRQGALADTPIGREVAENLMGLRYAFSRRVKSARLARVNLSYAHVLVVDDITTNLDVFKGMLRPYKVKIDCALSGWQAIDMIRSESPRYSAVFMDHMMPGMDGIEATRAIRDEIGTDYARNLPIIALTANAIHGNEEMFLSQGFQDFISKPIDTLKLDAVLRRWVRDKELEKEIQGAGGRVAEYGHKGAGAPAPPSGAALEGIDLPKALERFGGNETVFIDVLRSYAASTRSLLGDLQSYLDDANLADYAIVIHGIKGASYGLCAKEAGRAAERLEMEARAGDLDALKSGHPAFERIAVALLENIDKALAALCANAVKPVAHEPDRELLRELREACAAFDMDGADRAMAQLEAFQYERGGVLVAWLREQIDNMTFEEIAGGEWPAE